VRVFLDHAQISACFIGGGEQAQTWIRNGLFLILKFTNANIPNKRMAPINMILLVC
jgi:hypothetical protein